MELKIDEEAGEILMKGLLLKDYYKNEELTNNTIRGGWLYRIKDFLVRITTCILQEELLIAENIKRSICEPLT